MALEEFGVLDFVGEKVLAGLFFLGLLVHTRGLVSLESQTLEDLAFFNFEASSSPRLLHF